MIAEAAPNATILDWSWGMRGEGSERALADLGFREIATLTRAMSESGVGLSGCFSGNPATPTE